MKDETVLYCGLGVAIIAIAAMLIMVCLAGN